LCVYRSVPSRRPRPHGARYKRRRSRCRSRTRRPRSDLFVDLRSRTSFDHPTYLELRGLRLDAREHPCRASGFQAGTSAPGGTSTTRSKGSSLPARPRTVPPRLGARASSSQLFTVLLSRQSSTAPDDQSSVRGSRTIHISGPVGTGAPSGTSSGVSRWFRSCQRRPLVTANPVPSFA